MKVYLNSIQISDAIAFMADDIKKDYENTPITIICILKGAFIFCADLIRHLEMSVQVEFLQVSSYQGTESTGVVTITNMPENLQGKHVLIVEDIVDTGICLKHVIDKLHEQQPASLKVAALVSKPSRRIEKVSVDYVGFEIPDKFIVGYGLDYNQQYRSLPYIGVLED